MLSSISPKNIPPYCCPQLGAHTHIDTYTHVRTHTHTQSSLAVWLGEGYAEIQRDGEG